MYGLAASAALCPAALAEQVSALPTNAGFEDGVAAIAATRDILLRTHAPPARAAGFTYFAAYAVTALFGGATARGATAIFGVTAFAAAHDLIIVTLFLGESPPGKQRTQRGPQDGCTGQLQRLSSRNGAASQPFSQLVEGVFPYRTPSSRKFSNVVIFWH